MKNKDIYSIIIADDHEIVRSGIKLILEPYDELNIIAEASSYATLTDILSKENYDLLILDLNLGDKNGIHSIRELSDTYPDLPIIVLSMFPEDPYALQSIQAGAMAYVSKRSVTDELIDAISSVQKKNVYLNADYKDTLPYGTELQKTEKRSIESLSQREYEVYTLISSGISSKDIAEKLAVSPKTISTYRSRILSKLSLSNTNQLIHFAMQNDLGK